MRKAQALPISRKEDMRIIDLLIHLLYPLSLTNLRGIEMKKQESLRLMRLSLYILKSTKHSIEHSKRF